MYTKVFTASATLLTLALAALQTQADDPPAKDAEKTRAVDVAGIQFTVPESWKSLKPSSAMRKSQIQVQPIEGDKAPAELVLFVFPGGAGSVQANVERWRNQFTDANGAHPEVESKTVKGQNVEVTRVEAAGSYKDPFAADGPHENYRLLGAIVTTEDTGYFFKMVGPDKTMKAATEAFDKMLSTIKTQ